MIGPPRQTRRQPQMHEHTRLEKALDAAVFWFHLTSQLDVCELSSDPNICPMTVAHDAVGVWHHQYQIHTTF